MNSDLDCAVELIPYVDTGQQQRNLPLLCPSPPACPRTGTRAMGSVKRSPSPTEDEEPEQQSRKRRAQSESENPAEDDEDSAEGSNSLQKAPAGPVKSVKISIKDWDREKCIVLDTNLLFYPDFSNRKESGPLLLRLINNRDIQPIHNSYDDQVKNDFYKQIKEFYSTLNPNNKKKVKEKHQYAFYFFRKKDDSLTDPCGFFLQGEANIHCEEGIINKIEEMLKEQLTDLTEVYIYTVNSPCMARKNSERHQGTFTETGTEKTPCMILLYHLSVKLSRHKIKTYIAYSKPYGASGQIYQSKSLPSYPYRTCSYDSHTRSQTSITKTTNEDSQELELARKRIIKEPDLLAQFLMRISSKFKTELFRPVKENIPQDKRKLFFDIIKDFKCPKSPQTFDKHIEMGLKKSEELKNLLRGSFSEVVCQSVYDTFVMWWFENLEQSFSTFLNDRLSEGINTEVTELIIQDIQQLPHAPIMCCIRDIPDPDPEMCCSSPDNSL